MGNDLMVHAFNPDGTERLHFNATRLAPFALSVAHSSQFLRWALPCPEFAPLSRNRRFSFLLLSENVIIDDDTLYSLKIITDPGGRIMTFRSLTLMTGFHSTYFLNVVTHSNHPVNLDKAMRGRLLCDVAKDAVMHT
jgi:hypothetical protein